ncbi:hypothetical protein AZI86_13060 [Bdellovibrio bacteriovorus]|uniref:Uncharacterized protein n=1 Tax=Bdellovibrio bacteriovorus TaxID=959 RepID=A0A150WJ08_BDEBC|nr:hypothetical protein [Bdellovibrio bacteriovorus]KYG63748.1 hypothetical protein AZI86_13060 [Bdellovibrio bacteriovorus]
MNFFVSFIFVFATSLLGNLSQAEVLPGPALMTITTDFFKPGQRWHWKYYQDGSLYSTERYTVLSALQDKVVLEMSTKLAGESDFKVHHRLEVNPQKCLNAYKNPALHKPYSFELYYWRDGKWELVEGLTSPIPFEEKFNCNPHRVKSAYKNTFFQNMDTDLGLQEIFQQRKGRLDMSSWYFNLPDYPGILAYKRMSRPDERVQYHIRFSISE